MYCTQCGFQINNKSKFCSQCGTQIINPPLADTNDSEKPIQVPSHKTKAGISKKTGLINWLLAVITGLVTAYIVGVMSVYIGQEFLVGSLEQETLDNLKSFAFILGFFALWAGYSMVRISGSMPKQSNKPEHPFKSTGNTDHPTAKDVILTIFDLYETHGGEFALFSRDDGQFIQVVINEGITLNISWPFHTSPETLFSKKNITLPAGFQFNELQDGSHAIYTGPLISKKQLVLTVDMLYRKLYNTGAKYSLVGELE